MMSRHSGRSLRALSRTPSARRLSLLLAVGASSGLVTQRAQAGGFHVDEQDSRATGRGGAVTANPGNASAIYYNPAGIAALEGVSVDVGAAFIAPSASFTGVEGGSASVEKETFVLPQAFVSLRANEWVAAGLGFTAPFGLALNWPETSPGRTVVREAELRTFFITPTLGVNLSRAVPGLTFGAGLDLVPSSVRLTRDIAFGTEYGSVGLSGKSFGVGGRAGLIYRPEALRVLSLGVTYRSPVVLDFEGDADFDAPPAYRGSLPPDGEVMTSVTLPQSLNFGIMVELMPGWEIEVDGNWRGWSSYDRLDIELPNGELSSSEKNWKDTLTLRVGTELGFMDRYAARLGFIWDPTPVPDTTLDFQLPDADRVDLTAGFGVALSRALTADLAVMYVLPQERSTSMAEPLEPPIKGRFEVDAWILNLTIGMHFDTASAEAAAPVESAWAASADADSSAGHADAPCEATSTLARSHPRCGAR